MPHGLCNLCGHPLGADHSDCPGPHGVPPVKPAVRCCPFWCVLDRHHLGPHEPPPPPILPVEGL